MFALRPATPIETYEIDEKQFVQTDIDNGMNGDGLLVAKTLVTHGQAAHAVRRLQEVTKSDRPITDGTVAIDNVRRGLTADVATWGNQANPKEMVREPLALVARILLEERRSPDLVTSFVGELFPEDIFINESSRRHHPINVSWLTSVALAAAITDANPLFIVRLMRESEFDALMRYVYGVQRLSEDEVKALCIFGKDREFGPAPVFGEEAKKRTRRGITDALGNMMVWVDKHLAWWGDGKTGNPEADFLLWQRLLCGAAWSDNIDQVRFSSRDSLFPRRDDLTAGLRLVAVRK